MVMDRKKELENMVGMKLRKIEVLSIYWDWNYFFENMERFRNSVVLDMVISYLKDNRNKMELMKLRRDIKRRSR